MRGVALVRGRQARDRGLVRAYATAAGASIASAREAGAVLEARQQVRFQVRFPYPHSGAVQRAITRYDARSTGARYGELVELELRLPAESANGFERALADATAGSAVTRRGEVEWEPVG